MYDDENKEIQHDVRADYHKWEEVNRSKWRTTGASRHTLRASEHAILHNTIPLLACWDAQQSDHSIPEIIEVSISGNDESLIDITEEKYPEHRVYEEYKDQKHEDIEERTNREQDREDQGL